MNRACGLSGLDRTSIWMVKMSFVRLFQGLLFLASVCSGCAALAGWMKISFVAPRNSNHMEKQQLQSLGKVFLRPSQHQAYWERRRCRLAATAVASSTSHLVTGRSASGVLENCIEACVNTLGSFVGGTITGFVIGAFMGGTFVKVPDCGLLKSMKTKAVKMGGDWGKLTATFTGFTSLSTVIRGRNDQWDQVVGAAAAGAFLNRAKGPSGMMQGAATYGLFSLIFAGQSKQDPMDVVDVPVDTPTNK